MINMLFIIKFNNYYLHSNTMVDVSEDISDINISLINPFNSNQIDVGKQFNLSIEGIDLRSENDKQGIRFSPNMEMRVINSSLMNYKFNGNGGAIFMSTSQYNYKIQNCTFFNNSANNLGGTAYFSSSSSLFYQNCNSENSSALQSGGTLYITCPDITILNSYFANSLSSQFGGALYINQPTSLLIESSTFYKCFSGLDGGAIYVNSPTNNITYSKICIIECGFSSSLTRNGDSIYHLGGLNSDKMFFLFFSICSNGKLLGTSESVIYVRYGQQNHRNHNFTNNQGYKCSIGYFQPYDSSNFQYLNFYNNSSSNIHNLWLSNSRTTSLNNFLFTNYVSNNCSSSSSTGSFTYTSGGVHNSLILSDCIFLSNKIQGTGTRYLFFSVAGWTVPAVNTHFYITDGSTLYAISANLLITSSTAPYILTFYSTFLCYTPYELGGLDILSNCQTLPPVPTTCILQSYNEAEKFYLNTIFSQSILFCNLLMID